jgi:transcriptional regulator with GAF, ATPase, and Fis domain
VKLDLWQKVLANLSASAALVGELFRHSVARRRIFILVAAAFVCLYAVSVLCYVLLIPDIGLRCRFYPEIQRVYPEYLHLKEGQSAHDLEGKTVVQVGSHPVESSPQLLRALLSLRTDPVVPIDVTDPAEVPPGAVYVRLSNDEELVRVQLQAADGSRESVWCRPGWMPLQMLLPSTLWFLLKGVLFVVGALVFWKRPEDRSAAAFFLLTIVTFGAYMGGYHWSRILTQPVLLLVFMVCGVLLPAVSLHFYLLFPRPKGIFQRQPRWTLLAIYGPPLLFLLLLLSGYLRVRWLFHEGEGAENMAALRVVLAEIVTEVYIYVGVAAFWYLVGGICLIHSFCTARDATERNQVKWILGGVLLSLVPIGYTLYLAFGNRGDFSGVTWPMFAASACVTVAFTISITRYRLMQLDKIISSGVGYFLLSSLAGLVYYAVVVCGWLVFSQWFAGPSLPHVLGVSGAALVLMLVLDWLRGRVKRALDRRFYRDKYQLDRTLKRMSQAVDQLVEPPVLARRTLRETAELLTVTRGAIYLREGHPPLYRLADHLGPVPPLVELSSGCPLIEVLLVQGTLAPQVGPWVRPAASPGDPAQRQLHLLGGELAHAVTHEGQMLALIVLGPKESGHYTGEDLNLIAAFAQVTALALISAEGRRTIEGLTRDLQAKVEKIAEQQQRILALQSQLLRKEEGGRRKEEKMEQPPSFPPSSFLLPPSGMVGTSAPVRDLLQLVRKVADSQSTVLIRGESGTGKEVLARAIHDHSPRAGKPFVPVNCVSFSSGLLESELFGHVKGAFTSAHRDKVGRFESAHEGTLFLDEIGDVPYEIQTKLLRVLQERRLERVGSSESIPIDVRVLAATHQNLELLIQQGRFREDLYYRLNVISIPVPPLRERGEDIPELAQHFLHLYAKRCQREVTQIDDDALGALKAYVWPGNIRQLENVIERAVVIAEGPTVTLRQLPPELLLLEGNGAPPLEDDEPLTVGARAERLERDRREREQLVRALAATSGNKAEAARILGLARSTLVSRLKKHGLQ